MTSSNEIVLFEMLERREQACLEELANLKAEGDSLSREKMHERTAEILDVIEQHITQINELTEYVDQHPGMQNVLSSYQRASTKVMESVIDLKSRPADSEKFHDRLSRLYGEMMLLADLSDTRLIKNIHRHIEAKDLKEANEAILIEQD